MWRPRVALAVGWTRSGNWRLHGLFDLPHVATDKQLLLWVGRWRGRQLENPPFLTGSAEWWWDALPGQVELTVLTGRTLSFPKRGRGCKPSYSIGCGGIFLRLLLHVIGSRVVVDVFRARMILSGFVCHRDR
jgi:hypothetical protein